MSEAQPEPSKPDQPETVVSDKGNSDKSSSLLSASASGMGFWATAQGAVALITDFIKPWLPKLTLILAVACVLILLLAVFLKFRRFKPEWPWGNVIATSLIGVVMFGAVVAAQTFGPRSESGQVQGALAANIPGLTSAQTVLLPVSDTEKKLLRFQPLLRKGDSQLAAAEAIKQLDDYENRDVRPAMISQLLRSPEPPLRQVGLINALHAKTGSPLPIQVTGQSGAELSNRLNDTYLIATTVYKDSGFVYAAWGNDRFDRAVISNGEFTGYMADGTVFKLTPDDKGQLSGTARAPDQEAVPIRVIIQ